MILLGNTAAYSSGSVVPTAAMETFFNIESYVSDSHIGFDPKYEVIKKTRPTSNKTPDERMAYLVIVIIQEGNNK